MGLHHFCFFLLLLNGYQSFLSKLPFITQIFRVDINIDSTFTTAMATTTYNMEEKKCSQLNCRICLFVYFFFASQTHTHTNEINEERIIICLYYFLFKNTIKKKKKSMFFFYRNERKMRKEVK